jgi:ubiquinol-cytochrome c reductase iron-sulfur subunit
MSHLTRVIGFANKAQTVVITAAASARVTPKPDCSLPEDHTIHYEHTIPLPNMPQHLNTKSMGKLLIGSNLNVSNSFTRSMSMRGAHNDVKVPNFDEYRNSYTDNANESSKIHADDKQTYSYISTFGVCLLGVYGAKTIVRDVVANLAPSADVLALAKIEVNLADIPVGKSVTLKWRSKPLFIRHRTEAEISRERAIDIATLRDPQADEDRVQEAQWLVLLGICTHLGCVPLANAGDFNGYFCPCHGSHYDASGRIRKGPAPLNLEIPPYEFKEDLLVVG